MSTNSQIILIRTLEKVLREGVARRALQRRGQFGGHQGNRQEQGWQVEAGRRGQRRKRKRRNGIAE